VSILTNQFEQIFLALANGQTPPTVANDTTLGTVFVLPVVPDANGDGGGTVEIDYYPSGLKAGTDNVVMTLPDGNNFTQPIIIAVAPPGETLSEVSTATQPWDGTLPAQAGAAPAAAPKTVSAAHAANVVKAETNAAARVNAR
jgi:hypothetical protein